MLKQSSDSKKDNIVLVATFLLVIVVILAMIYVKLPAKFEKTETRASQPQDEELQVKQKTRREYIVKITTSRGHFGGILVKDENDNTVCSVDIENYDDASVTSEYKINAGVGDTVSVEVQFGGYVTVRLVKEGVLFDETIASKTDYDGVVFRYTIKEGDV